MLRVGANGLAVATEPNPDGDAAPFAVVPLGHVGGRGSFIPPPAAGTNGDPPQFCYRRSIKTQRHKVMDVLRAIGPRPLCDGCLSELLVIYRENVNRIAHAISESHSAFQRTRGYCLRCHRRRITARFQGSLRPIS